MNKPLKIPEHVLNEQFASSDPNVSAWVAANAGSGKTHVLTQRVIRLMLAGSTPDRILCLTFTKSAAANMKSRVFDTLAKWTMMDDEALSQSVEAISGAPVTPETRTRARRLFAQALDTPGGLKIQTIHAFCEALLHQFPLEANVPGHFETLQETGQAALLAEAKAHILAGQASDIRLIEYFRKLVEFASENAIEQGIASIVADRNAFAGWIEQGLDSAMAPVSDALGVKTSDTPDSLMHSCFKALPLDVAALRNVIKVTGDSDKARDTEVHLLLSKAVGRDDIAVRFEAMETALLTAKGETRSESRIVSKFVKDRIPDIAEQLVATGVALQKARGKIKALSLIEHSRYLFYIAEAVIERYAALKRRHGVIDFDDQVDKCAALLTRNEIRDWIRYRLDRGIDHVLVDEAQDTSPKQWEIINAITADFHSGNSASARNRTVFVVGDEKQSIYSFQGARPEEFAKQQSQLKQATSNAQKRFHPGKLTLSFRSTSDVLHAVDEVFGPEENRRGLMQSGEQPAHDAVRENDPGEVQVWPAFVKETVDESDSWLDPIDHTTMRDPAVQLADRIAETIGEWVGNTLPGSDIPLKYEDILVLVRKRDRFITALTRTIKDRGLQVAGADRLVLTDHIAVEDLLALGQFALLPSDDLNLACVLKGVLFDLDEETLFDFAFDRDNASLYEVIVAAAKEPAHKHHHLAVEIRNSLDFVFKQGNELNVFEFFAWALGPFGMRKAFLARLGMEAEDVLDAFLDETISFAREGGIGLERFIATLSQSKPEIKREVELERDEVRILTVHASKGLEARVVFLVDPFNPPWTESHRPPILPVVTKAPQSYLWLPTSAMHVEATKASTERISQLAQEEYRRLLYVGMTRAADRLIVCGYRGSSEPKHETWHSMVHNALHDTAETFELPDGSVGGIRWKENATPSRISGAKVIQQNLKTERAVAIPDWLATKAPQENPLPAPLTPTGAYVLIEGEDNQNEPFNPGHQDAGGKFSIQKGAAVHYLLECLPDAPRQERARLGREYLHKAGAEWTNNQRERVWQDVCAILEDDTLSYLFSERSSAEVSLTGRLSTRSGQRLIAGQIDRLVVREHDVAIIDYKTGTSVPSAPESIPPQYLTQMSLYRELVTQIYPDQAVRCYILWVHGPKMMQIEDWQLDESLEKVKKI